MNMVAEAKRVYLYVKEEASQCLQQDESLLYSLIKGFVQAGELSLAFDVYKSSPYAALTPSSPPSSTFPDCGTRPHLSRLSIMKGLLRGSGRDITRGLLVLLDVYLFFPHKPEIIYESLLLLLTSIAILSDPSNLQLLLLNCERFLFHQSEQLSSSACKESLNKLLDLLRASSNHSQKDIDIILICLYSCAKEDNLSAALDTLSSFQRQGLLPNQLFLSSFLEEAFASGAKPAAYSRTSLPFRSFELSFSCKYLSDMKPILYHLLTHPSLHFPPSFSSQCAPDSFAPLIPDGAEHDLYLRAYLSICLWNSYDYGNENAMGVLLLQRLHTLWLNVKSRASKAVLDNVLRRTFGDYIDINGVDVKVIEKKKKIMFAVLTASSITALHIPRKVLAKLVDMLLEILIIEVYRKEEKMLDLRECMCDWIKSHTVCLEILKSILKAVFSSPNENEKASLTISLLRLLQGGERPSRLVPLLINLHLCESLVQLSVTAFEEGVLLEELFVKAVQGEGAELHAICSLIKEISLESFTRHAFGRRMAHGLLTGDLRDAAARLLIQCQIDTSEDRDLTTFLYATRSLLSSSSCSILYSGSADFYQLPSSVEILWVNSLELLKDCVDFLLSVDVIGVDCEWRPFKSTTMVPTKCALLQLATIKRVFLIDLLCFESDNDEEATASIYKAFILKLFRSSNYSALDLNTIGIVCRAVILRHSVFLGRRWRPIPWI